MKYAATLAWIVALTTWTAGAYESVRELLVDQQKKQNEALEAYLTAKPEAADAAEARQRLIMGYQMAGEPARALPLMEKQYAALAAKPADVNVRQLMGPVSSILEAKVEAGKKEEARAFLAQVRKDFGSSAEAENINSALDRLAGMLNKPATGDAVSLKFKAIDGREVDLESMKGKVVLIDFWATWCGPCRAEMPTVKKVYADYHEKGFEILAISLDQEREPLDAYIKEQNLPWPQYFDGKAWETSFVSQFGVRGIPATFLIGKDGKLVAANLRGEALGREVERLLAP